MRTLIAAPVITLAVILQSSIVSRVTLLSGFADLPLVMLAAWASQEDVDSAWHWALATGALVGFVSGMSWIVPTLSYLVTVALAQALQRRIWRAPLLAMFSVTFLGTIVSSLLSFAALRFSGAALSINEVFGLLTMPIILLNMLLAIPVFAMMRDLARWVYPAPEVE